MKVILQENIDSLGYVGDVLDVADGYARNYLLPRQKALEANPRNVKALEHAKRVTAHKAKKVEHDVQEFATKLSGVSLMFPVQTGKDDKLFGSITTKDLEAGLSAEGFDVDRRKIQLANPLKELGTFTIGIKLHRDIIANVSVSLVKQDGEAQAETPVDGAADATAAVAPAETPEPQDPSASLRAG
ncbi:MAG: 50S ribosomal protein L9 [Nitrospira sp.]|nr:50S ribosomal protein L9 [Nitrospira sp.]MDE0404806.1 50S ribosomal protein L9 [Nitrospira sp.]MDE0487094.1 50S ribosomal protein L9 [Nitrospira sp.]